jgi:hypothetical protein
MLMRSARSKSAQTSGEKATGPARPTSSSSSTGGASSSAVSETTAGVATAAALAFLFFPRPLNLPRKDPPGVVTLLPGVGSGPSDVAWLGEAGGSSALCREADGGPPPIEKRLDAVDDDADRPRPPIEK